MNGPSSPSRHTDFAPLAAVITAMLSIALGATVAKSLFPLIGSTGTTTLRLVIASAIMAVVFRIWRLRPSGSQWRAVIPYGLSLGCMNLFFYMAIQRIPLGLALAFEFTGPLAVATFASRRLVDLCWVGLAVAGLLLLLPIRKSGGAIDHSGIVFAMAAGLFWACYIITGKRAGEALGAAAPALGMIIATMIALPFGVAAAGTALLAPHVLALASVVALLSSAIPYSLEMFALRRLPAQSFSILTSAEPVLGAVVAMIVIGETIGAEKWLGIAAIAVASIGTTLSTRSQRIEPAN
jgi:inner membrane transporter RhtA